MNPQDFIAQRIAHMQGLPGEAPPSDESNIMQYLSVLLDPFSKGATANPTTEDRVFGTYGYDPDLPEREGYAPELPPVGGGRHQIYPPTKEFGTDESRRIFRDFNYEPDYDSES